MVADCFMNELSTWVGPVRFTRSSTDDLIVTLSKKDCLSLSLYDIVSFFLHWISERKMLELVFVWFLKMGCLFLRFMVMKRLLSSRAILFAKFCNGRCSIRFCT